MSINIQIINREWIDYIIINTNININININRNRIKRYSNLDEGFYDIKDNILQIKWDRWGLQEFEYINGIYYHLDSDIFEIELENSEWKGISVFNKNTNVIFRKNYESERGIFHFEQNDLIITWENWGIERFYQTNYGSKYINFDKNKISNKEKINIKLIAIVFPQFHEIPENNLFWGDGFTEWTLLKNIPRIVNNEIIKQPHDDIGYFNLKDYAHRKYMRILANAFNIYGFCYYHYWFKDKKVMYEPTELMLLDGEPNKPFFFCWANEQWTKRWDGGNNEILIKQEYTDLNGNIEHFNYLLQFFKYSNYIKKNNKPIFIFYRIEEKDLNDIKNIITLWNELAIKEGLDGIHFMRFLGPFNNDIELDEIKGFVEFAPGYFSQIYYNEISSSDENKIFEEYNEEIYLEKNNDVKEHVLNKAIETGYDHYKILNEKERNSRTSKFFIYDGIKLYDKIIENKRIYNEQYRGISVNWNNTPRRNFENNEYSKYPHYFKNITPELFGNCLYKLLDKVNNDPNDKKDMIDINNSTDATDINDQIDTNDPKDITENFIFISSWNEWNEQAILEPNNEDGYDYLLNLNKTYLEFYNNPKKGTILSIGHIGGGTEKYMNDIKNIFIEYDFINFQKFKLNTDYEGIYKNLNLIHINSILFNNLKDNYNMFFNTFFKDVPKYLTLHDYQWFYPENPNIIKDDFLKNKPLDIYLENFNNLLSLCSKIIFPSNNIFNNYSHYLNFGVYKDKIYIVNHCDKIINYNFLVIPEIKNIINIAYIGYFINYKGCNILKDIAEKYKEYNNYKLIYNIYGYIDIKESTLYDNIIFHNIYKDNEIINKIHKNNTHGIMHLSLFEESYCYALTNSINSGLPILYMKRGVFQERLNNNSNNNKYFPAEIENINDKFMIFLDYIIKEQSTHIYHPLNENIQPNRWYLENYI